MTTPWDYIITGQFIEAILSTYTNVMGNFFYALVLFLGFVIIYQKTKNIGTVGIVALLISGVILTLLPAEIHNLAYFLIIFALTAVMYKAWKG